MKTHPVQSVIEELAVKAIGQGKTRGQFIRENTFTSTNKVELQDWSNGYTWAVTVLGQLSFQQEIQMENPPSSPAWRESSAEIHRLATILNHGIEPREATR